jgi:hypothetical protein
LLVIFIHIVAKNAPMRILQSAQPAEKQKYQKKIAPLKTLIVVSNT